MCNGVLMLIRFSVAFRDAYDKDRLDDAQWNTKDFDDIYIYIFF